MVDVVILSVDFVIGYTIYDILNCFSVHIGAVACQYGRRRGWLVVLFESFKSLFLRAYGSSHLVILRVLVAWGIYTINVKRKSL